MNEDVFPIEKWGFSSHVSFQGCNFHGIQDMQWVIAGFEGEVEAETKQVPMAKWRVSIDIGTSKRWDLLKWNKSIKSQYLLFVKIGIALQIGHI